MRGQADTRRDADRWS